MSKKTKAAVPVPQSYDAANALITRWTELDRDIDAEKRLLAIEAAKLKAQAEIAVKPLLAEQLLIEQQLEAYAVAHRDELTDGGNVKHHDMPAGRIGWRNDPPSIQFKRGFKEDDIVAALKEMRLVRFLRRTFTVNKQAMLDDPERAAGVPGIKVIRDQEQFFFLPVDLQLSDGEP